ncbi:MAG: hypothetical protein HWE27_14315 [Gammaproteobacteria bacterium]|nr:hypothetical protein [Gammaproteobacteria bacterium]
MSDLVTSDAEFARIKNAKISADISRIKFALTGDKSNVKLFKLLPTGTRDTN